MAGAGTFESLPHVMAEAQAESRGDSRLKVKKRAQKYGLFTILYRGFWLGVLPLCTVYVAAFIAYVSSTPVPAGTLFWLLGQLMLWMSTATPAVRLIDTCADDDCVVAAAAAARACYG